jgi:hypothetical protein
VESILQEMSADPSTGVQFVPHSRTMAIFKETSYMVSSRHGHPIHRDPEHPKEKPFPWKGLGYLRCAGAVLVLLALQRTREWVAKVALL